MTPRYGEDSDGLEYHYKRKLQEYGGTNDQDSGKRPHHPNKCLIMNLVTCVHESSHESHNMLRNFMTSCSKSHLVVLYPITPVPLFLAQLFSATDPNARPIGPIQSLLRATVQACAHNEST